jgi:hypothetical protein
LFIRNTGHRAVEFAVAVAEVLGFGVLDESAACVTVVLRDDGSGLATVGNDALVGVDFDDAVFRTTAGAIVGTRFLARKDEGVFPRPLCDFSVVLHTTTVDALGYAHDESVVAVLRFHEL